MNQKDRFSSRLRNAYWTFHEKHERLKNTIHNGFRYPLPRWGRTIMGFVYFSLPVIGGYGIMQWAISKSHDEIGERGEKLRHKQIEGIGNKVVVNAQTGETQKVGAGGWGGGVNLAVSDESIQKQNQRMLQKFLKQQRKLMNKANNEHENSDKKKQKKSQNNSTDDDDGETDQ